LPGSTAKIVNITTPSGPPAKSQLRAALYIAYVSKQLSQPNPRKKRNDKTSKEDKDDG
jgi:hypothetical protein